MPAARDGAGDVDEVHDRTAENDAQGIRVVRQDNLHHLCRGIGSALGRERHEILKCEA
jgi:hypothetical protein